MTILVELFIRKESSASWKANDYMRERAGLKRLLAKFPDFDFFYSLEDLKGKFNSLLGISDKYVKGLSRRYDDYCIEKSRKINYILEDKPVITIEEPKKVYQNVMEFLDN